MSDAFDDIPFAWGDVDYSLLSQLNSPHSIGKDFLGYLTMKESNALRSVCWEFLEAVMEFPDGREVNYQRQSRSMARGFFRSACGQCVGVSRYCRFGFRPNSRRAGRGATSHCEHEAVL